LAYRQVIKSDIEISKWTREKADADMTFLGFVGIYDPPRPESKDAAQICFSARIEVHMLTVFYIYIPYSSENKQHGPHYNDFWPAL